MTSGSAERTASSWSLPSKLSRRPAGTSRVHQNHLHHHRKSRHHGVVCGAIDTGACGDGEADEARARRECFYRYRNLNPRTVAYLFSRRHGDEDTSCHHFDDVLVMGRGEINGPYSGHHRHHESGGNSTVGTLPPLPAPPPPPPPYSSSGSRSAAAAAATPNPASGTATTTANSRLHSAASVGGGDGIPPELPPRPPHLCHPRDIENSSGHRSRSRTRRSTNHTVPNNNNNNSSHNTTTSVGDHGEPAVPHTHSSHHTHHSSQPHHHGHNTNNGVHTTTTTATHSNNNNNNNTVLNPELLPDILNSHLPPPPPPYSTLPQSTERSSRRGPLVPPLPTVCPPPSPPHRSAFLNPNLSFIAGGARRTRASSRAAGGSHYTPDDEPKHCCGVVVTQTVSIRWFIIMIAFVGLCCAVVGTVLGALKTTGREHLTVSLLMIGVGIVLITVSGIAWRLTSTDAPTCRMMLGFHSDDPEPNRRFVPRVPPSYGRSHHPYAAMMYPDFQYRPPPPSYQASMQEYRLRLLLLDRQHTPTSTSMSPVSPPPTYRSHISGRPPLTFARESDCSRPPSYRSRSSSVMPRPQDPNAGTATEGETGATGTHSRDPSLSLSCLSHESLFDARPLDGGGVGGTVAPSSVTGSPHHGTALADISVSVGTGEGPNVPPSTLQEIHESNVGVSQKLIEEERRSHRKNRDSNAVTIVQTTDSSQVVNQDAVIVTVSGHHSGGQAALPANLLHHEVEILAHL